MFNKSKNQPNKKVPKIKPQILRNIILIALLILLSLAAYLYFFKKSSVIEIFPDETIIKVKAKINTNLEDLIKKDSIVYDIIMKKRELDGKKTQLSESMEDPISILLNQEYAPSSPEDIFSKYSCIEPIQKDINQQNQNIQNSKQRYNFKITEIAQNESTQNTIVENLKSRQKQKYFYCDLSYFYDKNQAEKEYAKIRYIYAKIISQYPHTIHSKQKDDKYVYVLSIGRFNKFEEARSLCRKLIVQKQNCMVNQW